MYSARRFPSPRGASSPLLYPTASARSHKSISVGSRSSGSASDGTACASKYLSKSVSIGIGFLLCLPIDSGSRAFAGACNGGRLRLEVSGNDYGGQRIPLHAKVRFLGPLRARLQRRW